ncbi:MAG: molybdate ABC transporter substrate-binding protein [Thermoleophilia bacterium]|nr:molybdate ABC transporter substrate-binding protein [Thermoleophilia bacterium]MDH3724746.1 molybdate ABC transporter substrate-binding protein [Thermoleophilia bacterium]
MRWLAGAVLLGLSLVSAGCGASDGAGRGPVVVGGAASLAEPLSAFAEEYELRHPETDVQVEFAGSDAIAAKIRQGVGIDVFVSASVELAEALHGEGLTAPPVSIAGNTLVVAAPHDSPVEAIDDLDDPGVRLAIGNPHVPVGAYARIALSLVGDAFAIRAMENVRTNELDARGIVGKVSQGAVDAGVMYRTDAAGLGSAVLVVPFAPEDQPAIRYAAALVTDPRPSLDAGEVMDELTGDSGRRFFGNRGFTAP